MLAARRTGTARWSSPSRWPACSCRVFYVAPPFNLKRHGLGELDVFLTWGPLMIGGTYLVATGTVPLWVLVFSIPYALLVTSVLFGKHIDKIVPDTRARHSDAAGDPGRALARGAPARR